MIKYLIGSMLLIMLPIQAAQQFPPIAEESECKSDCLSRRNGKYIGLMSKRFYRKGRGNESVESFEKKYAYLSACYNQLEGLHTKAEKRNEELVAKNKILQRIAFDRDPHNGAENQMVPRFGNITISSNATVVTTTSGTGGMTTMHATVHTIVIPVVA